MDLPLLLYFGSTFSLPDALTKHSEAPACAQIMTPQLRSKTWTEEAAAHSEHPREKSALRQLLPEPTGLLVASADWRLVAEWETMTFVLSQDW